MTSTRTIRRTIRAALTAGQHVVSAAVSAAHRLLVRLYTAIDAGRALRIRYTDRDGTVSVRTITPQRLWLSRAGDVLVTAHDWRDGDTANFRADRLALLAA